MTLKQRQEHTVVAYILLCGPVNLCGYMVIARDHFTSGIDKKFSLDNSLKQMFARMEFLGSENCDSCRSNFKATPNSFGLSTNTLSSLKCK